MSKALLISAIALSVLGYSSPSTAQSSTSTADATKAVDQMAKTFDDAWDKGDIQGLGSLFTDDTIFITPGGIMRGREATEKNLALRAGKSRHYNTVDETHKIDDNNYWTVGSWKIVGGGPAVTGYWGDLVVRQGDTWRLKMLTINVTPPQGVQEPPNARMK